MNRRHFLIGASGALLGSCTSRGNERVTIYCSVDDVYARPILADIGQRSGLQIDALYDTEAAKTAGLANKIRAEKSRPRGDVFWSSALLQTLLLEREALLQPQFSPNARDLPQSLKSSRGTWTGVGVRRRVIVAHESLKLPPRSLQELLRSDLRGKIGISNPQFGTASDWVAALGVRWGVEKTLKYFRALKQHEVQVLAGNSVVADRVARGELLAGVTDSDDYFATHEKMPALRLVPTSEPQSINALAIPGSVAILKRAPHPDGAQTLLNSVLERRTELQLSAVMRGVIAPRAVGAKFQAPDDSRQWLGAWDKLRDPLAEILLA